MRVTIWYMYKPGDARTYAMTIPPAPEWAEIQAANGFKLFECLVDIPHEAKLEGYGDLVAEGTTEVALGPACIVHRCPSCHAGMGQNHAITCEQPSVPPMAAELSANPVHIHVETKL